MQHPYFDAETFLQVKDLPLTIKTLAQGILQSVHTSQQRGVGIEFSQFRSYEPGDELSKIDWKLFARSDKYFVREAERESDSQVWVIIDSSLSMLQKSKPVTQQESSQPIKQVGRWHKLDYARYFTAVLTYIAQQQGDSVGLLTISEKQLLHVPALAGNRHWQRLLLALTKLEASGTFPNIDTIVQQVNGGRKRGLVVIISDFHQRRDELTSLAQQLNNRYTDVIALHLDSHDEAHFNYNGLVRFEDLESGEHIIVSAKQARDSYLSNKLQIAQHLQTTLQSHGIDYLAADVDQPLDQVLINFLTAQSKARK